MPAMAPSNDWFTDILICAVPPTSANVTGILTSIPLILLLLFSHPLHLISKAIT